MRIRTTVLAACAAALLIPAAAQAATLSTDAGGTLVYKVGDSEATNLLISSYEDWQTGTEYLRFGDSAIDHKNVAIQTSVCKDDPNGGIICDRDPHRAIRVEGSNLHDYMSIFDNVDVPDSIPVTFDGRGGDDTLKDAYGVGGTGGRLLIGGDGNDELKGYQGNDTLDGGEGDDMLDGGEGDDVVRGGGGDDELHGDLYEAPGADVIDGGAGNDLVEDWDDPEKLDRQPQINVTQDGVANDGRPGENDNVTNVEQVDLYITGNVTGTEANDKIRLLNPANSGSSTLRGLGGDDEVIGYDYDDTVDGGAGNDHVEGGMGNDTVVGGPGKDVIYGDATSSYCTWYSCKIPFGNDTIDARDGEADQVDCGIGEDTATVDKVDTVVNCENVTGGGSNGTPGGGGGPGGSGPGGSGLKIASAKLAGSVVKVKVACASACTVKGSLKAAGKKIGSGKAKSSKARTVKMTVKLTKQAKRQLKRGKKLKASLKVTVTPKGGAAASASKKLTLKR
jgi:RTX calcium-binding nonapeptide repeat (4 copies)